MTPRVELLDWDTKFWGVRAARLHLDTEVELARGVQLCTQRGVEWASLLVPSDQRRLVVAAARVGFEIVDTRYEMSLVLDAGLTDVNGVVARPKDVPALAGIARTAFADSRFFNDSQLPNARCTEFYETWLRNSVNGNLADVVIVERVDAEVAGFVTVRIEGNRATLPLVAVAPDHHGRGVGRRLLSSALGWIRAGGTVDVEVVTQLTNVAAIALYTSAGFRLSGSGVWLHRWCA